MSFFHRTNRLGLTPEKGLWSDRTATQESGALHTQTSALIAISVTHMLKRSCRV